MPREIQRFEVSLKAFIVRDGRALFVREADSGLWELPGGRIDVGEEWEAHADVLAREIAEELGSAFRIEIGQEAVTWIRQRPTDQVFQFIVARIATPAAGDPGLSPEHSEMTWCGPEASLQLAFPPQSGYVPAIRSLWRIVSR